MPSIMYKTIQIISMLIFIVAPCLMEKISIKNVREVFVQEGNPALLRCGSENEPHDASKISWIIHAAIGDRLGNVQEIEDGTIIITNTALQNSGIYQCQFPDKTSTKQYTYKLLIYQESKRQDRSMVQFHVDGCETNLQDSIRLQLMQGLCGSISDPQCIFAIKMLCIGDPGQNQIMGLTILRSQPSSCADQRCVERSFQEATSVAIKRLNAIKIRHAQVHDIGDKISKNMDAPLYACNPGYYAINKERLCVPCDPGTYNTHSQNCIRCGKNSQYNKYKYGGTDYESVCYNGNSKMKHSETAERPILIAPKNNEPKKKKVGIFSIKLVGITIQIVILIMILAILIFVLIRKCKKSKKYGEEETMSRSILGGLSTPHGSCTLCGNNRSTLGGSGAIGTLQYQVFGIEKHSTYVVDHQRALLSDQQSTIANQLRTFATDQNPKFLSHQQLTIVPDKPPTSVPDQQSEFVRSDQQQFGNPDKFNTKKQSENNDQINTNSQCDNDMRQYDNRNQFDSPFNKSSLYYNQPENDDRDPSTHTDQFDTNEQFDGVGQYVNVDDSSKKERFNLAKLYEPPSIYKQSKRHSVVIRRNLQTYEVPVNVAPDLPVDSTTPISSRSPSPRPVSMPTSATAADGSYISDDTDINSIYANYAAARVPKDETDTTTGSTKQVSNKVSASPHKQKLCKQKSIQNYKEISDDVEEDPIYENASDFSDEEHNTCENNGLLDKHKKANRKKKVKKKKTKEKQSKDDEDSD